MTRFLVLGLLCLGIGYEVGRRRTVAEWSVPNVALGDTVFAARSALRFLMPQARAGIELRFQLSDCVRIARGSELARAGCFVSATQAFDRAVPTDVTYDRYLDANQRAMVAALATP